MTEAYNFLSSWQLFPERGTYEFGDRPKSGIYRLELGETKKQLNISMNWVTLEDQAFSSKYSVLATDERIPFDDQTVADYIRCHIPDSILLLIHFYRQEDVILEVIHEITPKGYLQVTQKKKSENGAILINVEIYHKQLSVLPYSASVAGAVIKPTEEGMIRHTALTAMEEQTNMQLSQIRQQIELLALQAREIQQRKELSMIIYDARLSFAPVIGKVYYLYEKEDHSYLVSMVSPQEWGKKIPFKKFVAAVQLLADHTWKEVQ